MDRIIIYKDINNKIRKYYFYDFFSYKEIKKSLKNISNIKNIINVQKFKLCPCCKDGYLEVNDKKGKELLKCLNLK
jgi:hypothetical protein